MNILAEIEIRISLADMKDIIDSINSDVNQVSNELDKTCNMLNKVNEYWNSESGNVYQELVNEYCRDVSELKLAFTETLQKLAVIHDNYSLTEEMNNIEAEALPDDILE